LEKAECRRRGRSQIGDFTHCSKELFLPGSGIGKNKKKKKAAGEREIE